MLKLDPKAVAHAKEVAARLRRLHDAKKYQPSGPGGQMCGCEMYRLVATGNDFNALIDAALLLDPPPKSEFPDDYEV